MPIAIPVVYGAALLISAITLWWFSTPQGINSINGLYNFIIDYIYNPAKQGFNNLRKGLYEDLIEIVDFVKSIPTLLDWVGASISSKAKDVADWVSDQIKELITIINTMATASVSAALTELTARVNAMPKSITNVADYTEDLLRDFSTSFGNRLTIIENWLNDYLATYLNDLARVVNETTNYIQGTVPPMHDWWNRLKSKIERLIEELIDLADTISDTDLQNTYNLYLSGGGWLMHYIKDTFIPLLPKITETIKGGYDIEG